MKISFSGQNWTYGSKKKKSNGRHKMCAEFRRLRKHARQYWKKIIKKEI